MIGLEGDEALALAPALEPLGLLGLFRQCGRERDRYGLSVADPILKLCYSFSSPIVDLGVSYSK